MNKGFQVTYETITPESAADGDVYDRGFLAEDVGLREAIETWGGIGLYVEANCLPIDGYRWLTAFNADDCPYTGAETSHSLHLPEELTEATRRRIARLVGCYGADQ